MLLLSFAIFTLLLVVVAVVLLFWALQDSSRTVISLSDRDLSEYDSLLESGKYDQFPTRTLLGRTGSIAVVDENGTVLFSDEKRSDFSAEELACIPLQGQYIYPTVTYWYDEQGRQMTLVANDGFYSVYYQTPVVLDDDHKILYGSLPGMDSDTLSDEAYGSLNKTIRYGSDIWNHPYQSVDSTVRWMS